MLKVTKFVGANTDFLTAQAFLFPRILPEGSDSPIFGLLISGEGEDIFVAIRQKILNLEEEFNAPFDRVTDKLHSLLERLKAEFPKVENLKITLFCAKENVFYCLQLGNNLVEILSEGKRAPIISSEFPQEKIISGFIKPNDRILVLSSRPDNSNWSDDVVEEVFNIAFENIADSEVIFAKDEQVTEKEEQVFAVKNIEPVAFILIENSLEKPLAKDGKTEIASDINPQIQKPKREFKIKINFGGLFLNLRKITRQIFGLTRLINKKLLIGLILIFILSTSGGLGYWYFKSKESERNLRRDNLITLIDSSLVKATSLKDTDQKGAIEELKNSSQKLKELESLDPENPKVEEIKKRYEEKNAEILRIYNNLSLELFLSLDLIKSAFQTNKMSFSVGKILVLDEAEKSLVALSIELKTPDILAGRTQLGEATLASLNGSDAFTYSPDKGLVHIDLDSKKASVVSSPDVGWGNIEDIFGFSSNLYVLDTAKSMIWKYAPIQSGFSQKQEYLKAASDLFLGKALVIDYSVWVLTSEPDVRKFTAGGSDYYAVSGVDEPITQIDDIFVTEELDSVFLLDKSKNRILVTKKNGEYLAQYINPEFAKVDDFFVDEENKSIYLLIENKIFETALK